MKLLVTFGSFDWILEFFGFDEVIVLVSLQVVWLGSIVGHWGRLLVDTLGPLLLLVSIR